MYLPLTVQTNLRPIVQSPPLIFRNCIGVVKTNINNYESFREIYEKCSKTSDEGRTEAPTTEAPTTTEEPSTTTEQATTTEEPITTQEPTIEQTTTTPNSTMDQETETQTTTESIEESTSEDTTTVTLEETTPVYEEADDGSAQFWN